MTTFVVHVMYIILYIFQVHRHGDRTQNMPTISPLIKNVPPLQGSGELTEVSSSTSRKYLSMR
jgi:hypothetical protein